MFRNPMYSYPHFLNLERAIEPQKPILQNGLAYRATDGAVSKSLNMDVILLRCQSGKIDFVAVLREWNLRKMGDMSGMGFL